MSPTRIILNSYYEKLYDLLLSRKTWCQQRCNAILAEELVRFHDKIKRNDQVDALKEACQAIWVERLEMYNPIGSQYLYDGGDAQSAFALELELDWYDAREEYVQLVRQARDLFMERKDLDEVSKLAEQLIQRNGAWPDHSIIEGYNASPAVMKLPDYVTAKVVEEAVHEAQFDQ